MGLTQAVVLGIIQGLTEFLPISSSAHLVLVPWIFRWQYQGLTYDVALHWGTLAAIAAYFWRDWKNLIQSGLRNPRGPEGKMLLGIAFASLPAAAAGVLLEEAAEKIFRDPPMMALPLIAFGIFLALAERLGRKSKKLEEISWSQMIFIGLAQAMALVPGVSRSGVTITAALCLGFKREAAARFSFLLALPITFGAGLMKLRDLEPAMLNAPFFTGVAVSALTGAAAIWLLMHYASKRDFGVFVAYRIFLGLFILVFSAASPNAAKSRLMALPGLINHNRSMAYEGTLDQKLGLHVRTLADPAIIGERNPYSPEALQKAQRYIVDVLKRYGYKPELHSYTVKDMPAVKDGTEFQNVIAVLPGSKPASEGIYVIGAHYDSAPGTPGADDNASGVAVLLELASALKNEKISHEIRFVAFCTEEPPSFGTSNMGSYHYAQKLKKERQKVLGMISLEMMGYYRDEKGSQLYPPPLSFFYPNTGNFIGFAGNLGSRKFLNRCAAIWRSIPGFPMVSAALPSLITAIRLSDHWSFIQAGYPAFMATDTAFFRNPHYHEDTDTPEKLDYKRMADLTKSFTGLLKQLAR